MYGSELINSCICFENSVKVISTVSDKHGYCKFETGCCKHEQNTVEMTTSPLLFQTFKDKCCIRTCSFPKGNKRQYLRRIKMTLFCMTEPKSMNIKDCDKFIAFLRIELFLPIKVDISVIWKSSASTWWYWLDWECDRPTKKNGTWCR